MRPRRSFGIFTLLAMIHFVVVGTASACVTPRGDASAVRSAHTECAPSSTSTKHGSTNRPAEVPCCTALASCAAAPLIARTAAVVLRAPAATVASAIAERAPRAESPAPELPPPRA